MTVAAKEATGGKGGAASFLYRLTVLKDVLDIDTGYKGCNEEADMSPAGLPGS